MIHVTEFKEPAEPPIAFTDLPGECQDFVREEYAERWGKNE